MITIGRITLTVVKRFQAENKPGLGEWAWRSGLTPAKQHPRNTSGRAQHN
jgi:hypothetical protein